MSRTAIVTGGLGHAGTWVVDRLARDGWQVVCVDLTHPGYQVAEREEITFRAADLTERAEALDLAAEFDPDAVVHFAAYPSPTRHADGRVFETNTMSTYHTLVAAGRAGAKAVWAPARAPTASRSPANGRFPTPCRSPRTTPCVRRTLAGPRRSSAGKLGRWSPGATACPWRRFDPPGYGSPAATSVGRGGTSRTAQAT